MNHKLYTTNLGLLQRLEHSLKRTAVISRKQETVNGFDIFVSELSSPYMNFAIPSLNQSDKQSGIHEMIDCFRQQKRQPRLEYFHELYPELKVALERVGFIQEMSAPVMVLSKKNLSVGEGTVLAKYRVLEDSEEELKAFLKRQNLAFGGLGDDTSLSWLDSLRQGLQQGYVTGAVIEQNGDIVSGAIIQGREDGELAGVWTLPSKQKQGLAYRVCHRLLSNYFGSGQDLCWLSAAEGAQKLYANLGFKVVGTQLNMRLATD